MTSIARPTCQGPLYVDFDVSCKDATGGQPKIQRKDYRPSGMLPVIDQGQSEIAGYTNDEDATYKGPLPAILFGDHTRIVKYVDKPFALGADGVKVLLARNGFESRFLYYFLAHTDIPERGYSRHFKFLREIKIPLFPLSEQRRIVEILDQADALRRLRAEADAKAQRILPALFLKMFGDPATNPMGWPLQNLGQLSLGGPQYGANARAIPYQEGAPRYVRITDITDEGLLADGDVRTLDLDCWEPYRLAEGDLLFARSGATVGKTYLYERSDGTCAYAGYLIRFRLDNSKANPLFIFALTKTDYYRNWVLAKRRTAAQPNINGQEYSSLILPLPNLERQNLFASAASSARKILSESRLSSFSWSRLFTLLLHRAFSGELTAKWREAHKEQLCAEMAEQAKLLNLPVPEAARAHA